MEDVKNGKKQAYIFNMLCGYFGHWCADVFLSIHYNNYFLHSAHCDQSYRSIIITMSLFRKKHFKLLNIFKEMENCKKDHSNTYAMNQ